MDFFDNLQAATNNLEEIVFNRFATVIEVNSDSTVNCKEDDGLTHNNVFNPGNRVEVGDTVCLMFIGNSIYDPVIIGNITHDLKTSFEEVNESINSKADKTHTHAVSEVSGLINAIYPVGSIYMSVNNTPPSLLFGGTWEQIEDTFLLASGSAYTAGDTGGSADAVVVKHNHTQNPHNHTQNSHGHLPSGGDGRRFMSSPKGCGWSERAGSNISGSGYYYVATNSTSHNVYNEDIGTTVATNQAATATNKEAGVDGTGKNMPPYLAVFMWKRTG